MAELNEILGNERIKEHEGRHGNLSESGNTERRYGDPDRDEL